MSDLLESVKSIVRKRLDELSRGTLFAYKKASDKYLEKKQYDGDTSKRIVKNRFKGIDTASKKLAKEEMINELGDTWKGKQKLKSYVKKSKESEGHIELANVLTKGKHDNTATEMMAKRIVGQGRAKMRLAKKR